MCESSNILFLMADQMQARVFDPENPCLTPNLDRLAARGVRFSRAYTSNAVCSPARASLMTGLLPHNHGVLYVTHTVDNDQGCLREDKPHWAQRLDSKNYRTGYFGKWHIERSFELDRFGWREFVCEGQKDLMNKYHLNKSEVLNNLIPELTYNLSNPGYRNNVHYGVSTAGIEKTYMYNATNLASDYLDKVMQDDSSPWCCFLSVIEPHDPFICTKEYFDKYNVDDIELPPNFYDELANRPGIYRKAARVFKDMTDYQKKQAIACYYATVSEIDSQFGRLIDKLEAAGQLDNTIIVVTTDHGELLGAHGLYCKNFSASEEIYNIPLIMAGPGIARGRVTTARVGLHDVCPTLLELTECEPIDGLDGLSFAKVLASPEENEEKFTTGFAEYSGARMHLTQRVTWKDNWKFVFNGYDIDELYNLADDPWEMNNLAENPDYENKLREMCEFMWHKISESGDHSLLNSDYPILRVAPFGPGIMQD